MLDLYNILERLRSVLKAEAVQASIGHDILYIHVEWNNGQRFDYTFERSELLSILDPSLLEEQFIQVVKAYPHPPGRFET